MKKNIAFIKPNQLSFIFGLCFVFIFGKMYGQEHKKHSAAVYATGVFSSLQYELEQQGSHTAKTGGGMGIDYTYRFNQNFGVSIGAEIQFYNSQAYFKQLTDSYAATDMEGENFVFNYTVQDYREKQQAGYLLIPLSFRYETKGVTGFYAALGGKIGFSVDASYQTSIQSLTTSGYYPQWDVTLYDPAFMGFGTQQNINLPKKDLALKNTFNLMFEAGVKQQVAMNSTIYIGGFVEFGLTNVQPDSTPFLVEYQTEEPAVFNYHSVGTTKNEMNNKNYMDEMKLFAVGVKLRYAIDF